MSTLEAPNKLMIMQVLGRIPYNYMIPNGLMQIFSGAPWVIRGVLGEIAVIWPKSPLVDWTERPW